MTTYPSLAAYTADVIRAREAYAADMRVGAGFCESGDENPIYIHRECRGCWEAS